LPGNSSE
ncbi:unnamed protein product, partial [Allacma fusca]